MQYKGLEILIYLCLLIIEASVVASFVGLLHWCMGNPGAERPFFDMIFGRYGLWVHNKSIGHDDRYREQVLEIEKKNAEGAEQIAIPFKPRNWYKPLGSCIYCMAVWISYIGFATLYALGLIYTVTPFPKTETAILFFIAFPGLVNTLLLKIRSHG